MSLGFASVGFFEFLEFPPAPGPGARSSWPRFLSSVDHSRGLRLSVSRERRGDAGESWPEAAGPQGAWAAGAGQCRARRCCARRAIDSGIPPVGPPRRGEGERGCVFLIKCDLGGGRLSPFGIVSNFLGTQVHPRLQSPSRPSPPHVIHRGETRDTDVQAPSASGPSCVKSHQPTPAMAGSLQISVNLHLPKEASSDHLVLILASCLLLSQLPSRRE